MIFLNHYQLYGHQLLYTLYYIDMTETSFSISSMVSSSGLQIKVINLRSFSSSYLQATIKDLFYESRLGEYFDTLEELKAHLEDINNIKIDEQLLSMQILANVGSKKGKQIILGKIPLLRAKQDSRQELNEVRLKCEGQVESIEQMKQIVGTLSSIVSGLYQKVIRCQCTEIKDQFNNQNRRNEAQRLDRIENLSNKAIETSKKGKMKIQKLQEAIARLQKKSEMYLNQTKLYEQKLKQMKATIQEKIKLTQMNVQDFYQKLTNKISHIQQQLIEKQKSQPIENISVFQKFPLHARPTSLTNASPIKNVQEWVDPLCLFSPLLSLKENRIQSKEQFCVFGKNKIINQYSYFVKLNKFTKVMGIGVNAHFGTERRPENKIVYCSNGSYKNGFFTLESAGKVWEEGEMLRVEINLEKSSIKWGSNKQVKYQTYCIKLRNKQLSWFPYIEMERNDQIRIYQ